VPVGRGGGHPPARVLGRTTQIGVRGFKEVTIRRAFRQGDPDFPHRDQNPRAEFEELEANRRGLCVCQIRVLQASRRSAIRSVYATEESHSRSSLARIVAQLVRSANSWKVLLLNAVLHIPAGTVFALVQVLRVDLVRGE